jgi:hypothetical protein
MNILWIQINSTSWRTIEGRFRIAQSNNGFRLNDARTGEIHVFADLRDCFKLAESTLLIELGPFITNNTIDVIKYIYG